jgi:pimeloyl-ACP methyl ester carboxylesterase
MRLCLAYVICAIAVCQGNFARAERLPIVFIPGIMGSKLCDGANTIVWGDRLSYTKSRINALRLPFDPSQRDKSIHPCGLIESVNIVPLLWESNVYSSLLKTLHELKYPDDEIAVFDYDWRLSNFDNATKLKETIETKFGASDRKIRLIAHSMGGLIARIYVQTLGGERRIETLTMLGTPHLGSASIFQRLKNGFENWPNSWSGGLAEIQRTILSFPSTYQLLPTYPYCCGFSDAADEQTAQYVDILAPSTWARFTWLPQEFKEGAGAEFLYRSLADTRKLKALISEPILKDQTGQRLSFIANGFLDTWSRVFFHATTGNITGNTLRPGDGTVLLHSASNGIPRQFQASSREHALVFSGPEAELALKTVLSDTKWFNAKDEYFTRTLRDADNNRVDVTHVSMTLEPRLVPPNSAISLSLTLKGSSAVEKLKLTHLVAQLLRDETVLESRPLDDGSSELGGRTVRFEFRAPKEPGPYVVRLTLPGVETFDMIFAVLDN